MKPTNPTSRNTTLGASRAGSTRQQTGPIWQALGVLFRAHPWHGVTPGAAAPQVLTAFIEVAPSDTVRYELEKVSGLMRVACPQTSSNASPTLHGFIPQTLCAEQVAARCEDQIGRRGIVGDDDPLDICVLAETPIAHGNVLVEAIPIGGLRMLEGNAADDTIIAVLEGDPGYGQFRDIQDCPAGLLERLKHYFLTYKQPPDGSVPKVEITQAYGREEAHEVIRRSQADYAARFSGLSDFLAAALT